MNGSNELSLTKYDLLLAEYPDCHQLYNNTIECREGWYDIIKSCFEAVKTDRANGLDAYAVQIKEKFGTLRIYTNNVSEDTRNIIIDAEERSSIICEETGNAGKLYNCEGWLKTLSEEFVKTYDRKCKLIG